MFIQFSTLRLFNISIDSGDNGWWKKQRQQQTRHFCLHFPKHFFFDVSWISHKLLNHQTFGYFMSLIIVIAVNFSTDPGPKIIYFVSFFLSNSDKSRGAESKIGWILIRLLIDLSLFLIHLITSLRCGSDSIENYF